MYFTVFENFTVSILSKCVLSIIIRLSGIIRLFRDTFGSWFFCMSVICIFFDNEKHMFEQGVITIHAMQKLNEMYLKK